MITPEGSDVVKGLGEFSTTSHIWAMFKVCDALLGERARR